MREGEIVRFSILAILSLLAISALSTDAKGMFSHVVTDLEVSAISADPFRVILGEEFRVNVKVTNNGAIAISTPLNNPAYLEVIDESTGKIIGTEIIEDLGPGQSTELSFSHIATEPKGLHRIKAVIDSTENIIESNEFNNENYTYFATGIPPSADILHSPENPNEFELVTFRATGIDSDGTVNTLSILVDGDVKFTCFTLEQPARCSYTGGGFGAGDHTYWAEAYDNDHMIGKSEAKTLSISRVNRLPSVTAFHQRVIGTNNFIFDIRATDYDGTIGSITVRVDGIDQKTCVPEETKTTFTCSHTGGPYQPGQHTYEGIAVDNEGGIGSSGTKTFNV